MSESAAHINKTLEDLKQQLAAKVAEAKKVLAAVNTLEELLGLPQTTLGDLGASVSLQESVGISDSVKVTFSSPKSATNSIRPDEYLGVDPLKAAKQYMRRVGRAVHIDEIAEAISKGGAAISGAAWKDKLLRSLTRSTADVVKVQEGTFGLAEFYTEEQLKGLRSVRRQRASTPELGSGRGQGQRRRKRRRKASGELRS